MAEQMIVEMAQSILKGIEISIPSDWRIISEIYDTWFRITISDIPRSFGFRKHLATISYKWKAKNILVFISSETTSTQRFIIEDYCNKNTQFSFRFSYA